MTLIFRIHYVVEFACIKAWATNLCNQFKSCSAKVEENICTVMAKKTSDIQGRANDKLFILLLMLCHYNAAMENDLEQSKSQYESIMDRKNKIKSKASRKGMEDNEVWKALEQSYEADLKVRFPAL